MRLFLYSIFPFLCTCPVKWLSVYEDETVIAEKNGMAVTYHLSCMICNKKHDISYFKLDYDAMKENVKKKLGLS